MKNKSVLVTLAALFVPAIFLAPAFPAPLAPISQPKVSTEPAEGQTLLESSRKLLSLRRFEGALEKALTAARLLGRSKESLLVLAAAYRALDLGGPWLETMVEYCAIGSPDPIAAELTASHLRRVGRVEEAAMIDGIKPGARPRLSERMPPVTQTGNDSIGPDPSLGMIAAAASSLANDPCFPDLAKAALAVKRESPRSMEARNLAVSLGNLVCKVSGRGDGLMLLRWVPSPAADAIPVEPAVSWVEMIRVLDLCAKSCSGIEPERALKFSSLSGLTRSFVVSGPLARPLKSGLHGMIDPGTEKSGQEIPKGIPGSLSQIPIGVSGGFLSLTAECVHGVYRATAVPDPGFTKSLRFFVLDAAVPAMLTLQGNQKLKLPADPNRETGRFSTIVTLLHPGDPVPTVDFIFRGEDECIRVHIAEAPPGVPAVLPVESLSMRGRLDLDPGVFKTLFLELAEDSTGAAEAARLAPPPPSWGWIAEATWKPEITDRATAVRVLNSNPGSLVAAIFLAGDQLTAPDKELTVLRRAAGIAEGDPALTGGALFPYVLSSHGRHLEAARAYLGGQTPPGLRETPLPLQRRLLGAGELLKAGAWAEASDQISSLAEILGPTREILRMACLADLCLGGKEGRAILETARAFHPSWDWAAEMAGEIDQVYPVSDLHENLNTYPSLESLPPDSPCLSGDLLVLDDLLSVKVHHDNSWTAVGSRKILVITEEGGRRALEEPFPPGAVTMANYWIGSNGIPSSNESPPTQGPRPGDVMVRAWRSRGGGTAGTHLDFDSLPIKFGVFDPGQRGDGIRSAILKVSCPADFSLGAAVTGMKVISDQVNGGFRTVVWSISGVAPVTTEPMAPPKETFVPSAIAGGGITWMDAGEIIQRRIGEHCKPSAGLITLAGEWTSPDLLVQSRIRGLTDRVFARVPQSTGNSDFSASAARALETGKGNRLGVVKACLDLMGVSSEVVMVNPRLISRDNWSFPDPDSFSHCLLRISLPGDDLWLDPASRFCPLGFLLEPVAGTKGLAIGEKGGRIVVTPAYEQGFETIIGVDGSIGEDRVMRISYTETHTGTTAAYLRESFARLDRPSMRATIESGLKTLYEKSTLLSWTVSKLEDAGTPLVITAILNLQSPSRKATDSGKEQPRPPRFLPAQRLASTLATTNGRFSPLLIPSTRSVKLQGILQTPPGTVFKEFTGEKESRFGWFSRRDCFTPGSEGNTGALAIEAALVIPMQVIDAADYGDFAKFCREADGIDCEPL